MAEIERISAEAARRKVQSGQALLVCAYDDEAKCASMKLEGALNLRELRDMAPSLPKDREIILYCA
jgi:rhodanese-related sulfurtransferase